MKLTETFVAARAASRILNLADDKTINAILNAVADEAIARTAEIIKANALDLSQMPTSNPMHDRLMLTPERIEAIAADLRQVASLPSPLGRVISSSTRSNGLEISKISVPFGVIGVIYEARPNVSFDVFALCLKSGNASILKGGSDAHNSNSAIVTIIKEVLRRFGMDENVVSLLPAEREYTAELLNAVGLVDLIIPRGSASLIEFVRNNSRVPVIETGAGICHTYFDKDGDVQKAERIVFNAKTRRISVCNALDCLIIHRNRLADLPEICANLASKNVTILADPEAWEALAGKYPETLLEKADEKSFGTEFLDYKMSVKTVADIDEAIEHITRYSSMHSEAIISENTLAINKFCRQVDAACVYANASTAFTDGSQFGFGAEIGISTQKLHARGPMALPELTSYKYIIVGNGQTREN